MPTRIQRKRSKGWRMPPNTKYVGRPTKWGNPFLIKRNRTCRFVWDTYTIIEDGIKEINGQYLDKRSAHAASVEMYRKHLAKNPDLVEMILTELSGCDHLACWCPLSEPCHVDVIIDILHKK